jgi:hypothetical protein
MRDLALLTRVSKNDPTATPSPALEFAHEIGVVPFIFGGPCGYCVHPCPDNGMNQAILRERASGWNFTFCAGFAPMSQGHRQNSEIPA